MTLVGTPWGGRERENGRQAPKHKRCGQGSEHGACTYNLEPVVHLHVVQAFAVPARGMVVEERRLRGCSCNRCHVVNHAFGVGAPAAVIHSKMDAKHGMVESGNTVAEAASSVAVGPATCEERRRAHAETVHTWSAPISSGCAHCMNGGPLLQLVHSF